MSVIVFTDQHDRKLLVLKPFTESGLSRVGNSAPFSVPGGLCLDGQGNVIVADSGNHCLTVRDLWSGSWQSFGSQGSGQGEFAAPSAVATDESDRVYVVDAGNRRVVRMDPLEASEWLTYGTAGTPTAGDPQAVGKFADPRGIAIDGKGRICVTDPAARRAVRFDAAMDGTGWAVLPLPTGANPVQPVGVAAGNGWIAVSDVGNRKVHVLDLDDELLATLDGMSAGMPVPAYLAFDGQYLVVADIVSTELRRFGLQGQTLVSQDAVRGSSSAHITPLFQQIGGSR